MKQCLTRIFPMLLLPLLAACALSQTTQPVTVPQQEPVPSPTVMVLQVFNPTATNSGIGGAPEETAIPAQKISFWTVNETDRVVNSIDIQGHTLLNKVQLSGVPKSATVYQDTVWVLEWVDEEHSNAVRIDPQENAIIARIPLPAGSANTLLAGNGAIWVGLSKSVDTSTLPEGIEYVRPGLIVRIDTQQNLVSETIDTDAVVNDLFLEDTILWSLEQMNMSTFFERIDLASRVISTIPSAVNSSEYIHEFSTFSMNQYGIWASPLDTSVHYIFHVDPNDGRIVATIEVGQDLSDAPIGVVATDAMVWVALKNGKIVQIDPLSEQVIKTTETGGSNLSGITFAEEYIWGFSRDEAKVYQIHQMNGEVVASYDNGSRPPVALAPTASATPELGTPYQACENTYLSRLAVGMRAEVSSESSTPNRVRAHPNLSSDITGFLQPSEAMIILEGPTCADGWVWWKIISETSAISGWTSEGDSSGYWLNPLK